MTDLAGGEAQLLLHQTEDGRTRVEVRTEEGELERTATAARQRPGVQQSGAFCASARATARIAGHLCLWSLVVVSCRPGPPTSSPGSLAGGTSAASASNRFGFDLLPRLRAPTENVVASPASAEIALAMAAAGARGETLDQMARVLRLPADGRAEAHEAFAALPRGLEARHGRDGLDLAIANRVWARKGGDFEAEYLALLAEVYRAPLGLFDAEAAHAEAVINAWVSEKTRGRIPALLPALARDAAMVLTSAVYMKAAWVEPFEVDDTRPEPFFAASERVAVPMMRRTGHMAHAHVDGVQVLELRYKGGLAMVVFLPGQRDGLAALEGQIGEKYERWIGALREKQVEVRLPRWAIASELELRDALVAMGMPAAFTRAADFSGISRATPLMIGRVLQKAVIEVNERGTEAAAATAVEMLESGVVEPVSFVADHPFVYVVRDSASGVVLFLGRVARPAGA